MVFERLAKPWGAILSGFDSQSLRHFMEACDNWLVGLSRIQVRGNPLGVRVAPLPPFSIDQRRSSEIGSSHRATNAKAGSSSLPSDTIFIRITLTIASATGRLGVSEFWRRL